MKKFIFTMLFFISMIFISCPTFSFELEGAWKAEQKYPINVIQFDKNIYKYGKYSEKFSLSQEGDMFIVNFRGGKIKIHQKSSNVIEVTYPHPALPKNIKYTRITKEEARILLNKN